MVHGNELELVSIDDNGRSRSLCRTPVFATIQSLAVLSHASGQQCDRVALGSDSGHVTLCEYFQGEWKLISVSCNLGPPGCRRNVPGQYICTDAGARAVMTCSVESTRLVLLLREDGTFVADAAPLVLPGVSDEPCIIYGACAVAPSPQTQQDNPPLIFATLEATAAAGKRLVFYEIDPATKHLCMSVHAVPPGANVIIGMPGLPGCVLVAGTGLASIYFLQPVAAGAAGAADGPGPARTVLLASAALPDLPATLLITSAVAVGALSQPSAFLCTEAGHLLEARFGQASVVGAAAGPPVDSMALSLVHTGAPALLALTRGAQGSLALLSACEHDHHRIHALEPGSASAPAAVARLLDTIPNSGAYTDMLVEDVAGIDLSQVYLLCGRGPSAALKVVRPGAGAKVFASSQLPAAWGAVAGIWALRATQSLQSSQPSSSSSAIDTHILISYASKTVCLAIQGDTVATAEGTKFLLSSRTLGAVVLDDGSVLQTHTRGLRHISAAGAVSDWTAPDMKYVDKSSANSRQVLLALKGGELIYFEMDASGQLLESGTHDVGKDVTSIDIGLVPPGQPRSLFAAVGCWDDTLQMISLAPQDLLAVRNAISFVARPQSLCFSLSAAAASSSSSSGSTGGGSLFLYIGLTNGELIRMAVHPLSGALNISRQLVVSQTRGVSLVRLRCGGGHAVLVLSSRTMIMHQNPAPARGRDEQKIKESALPFGSLDHACSLATLAHPEAVATICGDRFVLAEVGNLGAAFSEESYPLKYTPKRLSRLPGTKLLAIIESEQCAGPGVGGAGASDMDVVAGGGGGGGGGGGVGGSSGSPESRRVDAHFSPSTPGRWRSCLRCLDVTTGVSPAFLELPPNTAALSLCCLTFGTDRVGRGEGGALYVVVGTATNLPSPHTGATTAATTFALVTYTFSLGTRALTALHCTELDEMPLSMWPFQNRLLVGVGRCLRLYDVGRKKLLRKCELRGFPTSITRIQVSEVRETIFVGDLASSVVFVHYDAGENALRIIAEEARRPRCAIFSLSLGLLFSLPCSSSLSLPRPLSSAPRLVRRAARAPTVFCLALYE